MIGSNYPVDKQMGVSPERLFVGLDGMLGFLDNESKEQIYFRTAARFYRIPLE